MSQSGPEADLMYRLNLLARAYLANGPGFSPEIAVLFSQIDMTQAPRPALTEQPIRRRTPPVLAKLIHLVI